MPDKDIDRREDVLNDEYRQWVDKKGVSSIYPPLFPAAYKDAAKMAMDEYFTERAYELLEYMAKNDYVCYWMEDDNGNPIYRFSNGRHRNSISKEQLFENFL